MNCRRGKIESSKKRELVDPGGTFSRHIFNSNSGLTFFDCRIIGAPYK